MGLPHGPSWPYPWAQPVDVNILMVADGDRISCFPGMDAADASHPLLCGSKGAITVLSDDMHEGECALPASYAGQTAFDPFYTTTTWPGGVRPSIVADAHRRQLRPGERDDVPGHRGVRRPRGVGRANRDGRDVAPLVRRQPDR